MRRMACGLTCLCLGLVRSGQRLDFPARMFPRALDDPRHGSLQPLRFFLDLLEHRLRKVEALFALVALRDLRTAPALVVSHGFWLTVSHIVTASVDGNAMNGPGGSAHRIVLQNAG